MSNYQQILRSLTTKLSLGVPAGTDLPDRIGICFDSDITINIELMEHLQNEKIVLTGKVGSVAEFGTFFDVCALVAKSNFYLADANGCSLSVHDASQTVYVQYAFPLLPGNFSVIDVSSQLLEKMLTDVIELIKHVRLEGLHGRK